MNVSTSGPNRYAGLEVLGGIGGTSVLFQVGLPAGQTNAAVQSWTLAGTRPSFEVVTGVSTGALIAPFAFLGPHWDKTLREAYAEAYA